MALQTWKNALESIRKIRKDISAQIDTLETKRETLKRQRDELIALPPPRESVVARMEALLDHWTPSYDVAVAQWIKTISRPEPPPPGMVFNPLGLKSRGPTYTGSTTPELDANPDGLQPFSVVAVLSSLLKERLRQVVEAMDWPERVGPPDEERAAKLKLVDGEIAELDTEIARLLRQARDAGIEI